MSPILIFLFALAAPQDEPKEVPIQRISKDAYLGAIRELSAATELIDSEPREAIAKITNILSNTKIRYFEVRLKIEMRPSEFERHTFFPYLARGRAYLSLAKKTGDPNNAKGSWDSAIADLQKSVDAKVGAAAEQLAAAKAGLAKCMADIKKIESEKADNPVVDFRRKFDRLTSDFKFKGAAALVDGAEGQKITEEERQQFRAEAEDLCAKFVDGKLFSFRQNLGDANVRSLRDMPDRTFRIQYTEKVPAESELTEKTAKDPVLGWVRRHVKTLYTIQSNSAKLEDLFGAAGEALALDPPDAEGENFYFRVMAVLASEIVEETIAGCAGKSERLKREERTKLQAEADKAHAAWKEFIEKTDKKVLDRHRDLVDRGGKLADAAKAFPVDMTQQLAAFDIEACFSKDPAPELFKLERDLMEVESNLPRRVAIESRQELYTKLVNAGALRRFLQGLSESDVIQQLRPLRDKLKDAGGPINPGYYGPKVRAVFEGL